MDVNTFFNRQLQVWELARKNFNELAAVQTRELKVDGMPVTIQFNPARMVSTGASIDKKTIAERPCFLCQKNRPAEQMTQPMLECYELLINPFPILPRHFTLPSMKHEPQSISSSYIDLIRMTKLLPTLFLFYNGPRCGASAPDHLHFQAGQRGVVPLERDFMLPDTLSGIHERHDYIIKTWTILASTPEESEQLFHTLYDTMPIPEGDCEPMMNILAWYDEAAKVYVSIIIPRRKHRPDCYYAEGKTKCLVSPGALDMGGLIITPRQEDFENMTAERAKDILREVGL